MYTLSVESHIDAAHSLRGYKGKCETLHGHRFRVAVKAEAERLDNIGLAYDFQILPFIPTTEYDVDVHKVIFA